MTDKKQKERIFMHSSVKLGHNAYTAGGYYRPANDEEEKHLLENGGEKESQLGKRLDIEERQLLEEKAKLEASKDVDKRNNREIPDPNKGKKERRENRRRLRAVAEEKRHLGVAQGKFERRSGRRENLNKNPEKKRSLEPVASKKKEKDNA